jgi:hypothetical protein
MRTISELAAEEVNRSYENGKEEEGRGAEREINI